MTAETRTRHDRAVETLRALASLVGCGQQLEHGLPDGRRPDVLQLNTGKGLMFVGDAKDSETPGTTASRARLQGYLSWVSSFLQGAGRRAVVAICVCQPGYAESWRDSLESLAAEVGIHARARGALGLGPRETVLWWAFAT